MPIFLIIYYKKSSLLNTSSQLKKHVILVKILSGISFKLLLRDNRNKGNERNGQMKGTP